MAPAMHASMYNNPILKENIEKLKDLGVRFIEPDIIEGKAKVASIDKTLSVIINFFKSKLRGKKLLITAGATYEAIDDVRIITNKSSGKMGIEIVKEALLRGAEVTLIYGRISVDLPKGCKTIKVESTEDLLNKVKEEILRENYNSVILAGAPSDFKVENKFQGKIDSRKEDRIEITLIRTPKIIEEIRKMNKDLKLVAFKAEYNLTDEELIKKARDFLKLTGADLVVANDVARPLAGFEKDTNEVFIVSKEGWVNNFKGSKSFIASKILDLLNFH
ncbi:Coenzyme A biosynthesis bifunctional protein CoaBC [archaeon HR06]|nr:Coenzyme A biosynthesis bifunctional protein CoaBC [archaeon HR06]